MLATILFAVVVTAWCRLILSRWLIGRDSALSLSISGLAGLGSTGLIAFLIQSLPSSAQIAASGIAIVSSAAIGWFVRKRASVEDSSRRFSFGIAPAARLAIGLALVPVLLSLIGAAAPSTTLDWDSLAYHLAVPKIWNLDGQTSFISYIHHSNFPLSVDTLFMLGLKWGGEAGAKTFSVVLFVLAIMGVFGATREAYGEKAAVWAASAYATIPMAIWLSGTAYIDVAHGAFGGLGLFLIAQYVQDSSKKSNLILAGLMLGFSLGTKYTGLQTLGVATIVALVFLVRRPATAGRLSVPAFAGMVAIAVVVSAPWYVRNVVNTGNPVYPFFYSALGGKNWSDYNAKIYSNEQQTFGAGREMAPDYTAGKLEPARIGASILGLAYQPGRYTNPLPTQGGGLPMGAVGPVIIGALLAWLASGRMRRFEGYLVGCCLFSLATWFVLSQQSRYMLTLAPPLCILAGGAIIRLSYGKIIAVLVPIQAAFALYLNYIVVAQPQLDVVAGKMSPADYRRATTGFAEAAEWINAHPTKRVALYDEVFGYLLDVPYFWANPGHTTELGYESMNTGADLVENLRRLGIDRVYINTSIWPKEQTAAWLFDAGITPTGPGMTEAEKQGLMNDLQVKWKPLLAEAIRSGELIPETQIRRGLIFKVR